MSSELAARYYNGVKIYPLTSQLFRAYVNLMTVPCPACERGLFTIHNANYSDLAAWRRIIQATINGEVELVKTRFGVLPPFKCPCCPALLRDAGGNYPRVTGVYELEEAIELVVNYHGCGMSLVEPEELKTMLGVSQL